MEKNQLGSPLPGIHGGMNHLPGKAVPRCGKGKGFTKKAFLFGHDNSLSCNRRSI
jgi:hypothetical protein